jgi:O-antigen ligase
MINRILLWLSLALIFSIPWEDMFSLPVIGSTARLAGIMVFGFWFFKIILTGHIRKLHIFHAILYLFILWNVASIFWTFGFDETKARIITYTQLFIMALIFWDTFRTPRLLYAGLQAYVFGAWIGVIDTLINFISGVKIDAYEVGRYSASGVNAGDFVVILTLGIPMAWYLARFAKPYSNNHFLRIINYAYVPVAGSVIFLTGSRLALFVTIPALIYLLGTILQPKRILASTILLIILAGMLVVFQSFIPQATWERLTTAKSSIAQGDLGGRVPLWKESLKAFSDHPLLGVGSGAFRVVNPYKAVAHNTYLSVLAELGVVGLVLFISIVAVVGYSALQHSRGEAFFWLSTLLILLIGITVQTWEFTKTTLLIFSLVVISANIVSQPIVYEQKFNPMNDQSIRGRLTV